MEKLIIKKSKPLNGKISINGSKNSALPILVTSLLTGKECIFKNIPNLTDIKTMLTLLNSLGVLSKKFASLSLIFLLKTFINSLLNSKLTFFSFISFVKLIYVHYLYNFETV